MAIPAVSGFTVRPPWGSLAPTVRAAVDAALGAPVSATQDIHGGMSPGPAALLDLRDGRRVFAKASSATVNETTVALYRRELAVLAALPRRTPAPTLVAAIEVADWLAVITTAVPGASPLEWDSTAVSATLAALDTLPAAPPPLPSLREVAPALDGWADLAEHRVRPQDAWESSYAAALARVEWGWQDWTEGGRLTHADLRTDNLVLTPDGTAVLVDWAYGCAAAPWVDCALLAADLAASGRTQPGLELLDNLPAEAARLVVAYAGMLRRNSTRPPHPGLPTFRGWQRARYDALRPLLEAVVPALVR